MIAPDFPGFGRSDRPRAADSPASSAELVTRFLDALHVPGAVVAGNSLGGLAALRFALADLGRVSALVLVGSAGLGREVNPGMRLLSLPGLGESATACARTRPGEPSGSGGGPGPSSPTAAACPPDGSPIRTGSAGAPTSSGIPSRPCKRWSACPANGRSYAIGSRSWRCRRGSSGARDRVVLLAQARDAVGRPRRGRLAVIPDCGHLPQIERPEHFLEALGSFLDGPAGSGGSRAGSSSRRRRSHGAGAAGTPESRAVRGACRRAWAPCRSASRASRR